MTPASPRIAILLATFNGAAFLAEQLDSLRRQSVQSWRLVVSDDGSTDGTRAIVEAFAASMPGRVSWVEGPRQGATANFLSLVSRTLEGEWLAYCDQDDVWLPERLARGVEALTDLPGPAVHAARTVICAPDLTQLGPAPLFTRTPGFRNALVQACLPGNTTLVNAAGAALLRRAVPAAQPAGIVSHDWWTYQILSGTGAAVLRDPAQTVLYRQHAGNVMGRNDTMRARLARLVRLGSGDYGGWLRANQRALAGARGLLAPENRTLLDRFGGALDASGPVAAAAMARMGLYRQTRAGTAALLAAAAAGRLRRKEDG